jgi:hypothetical protein
VIIVKILFSVIGVDSGVQGNEAIVEKILQLGVNPNSYETQQSPLVLAMWKNSIEKIKLLLSYKAEKQWHNVISCILYHRFIDTIVTYCTKDELNDGLIACASDHSYRPEIMQKLIDNGAEPSVALPHAFEGLIKKINTLTPNASEILNFNFLCNQEAYDETVCTKVQNLQTIFSSLANKLEQNKPVLNDNI